MLTGGLERIILEMVRRGPDHGFVSSVVALKQAGELAEEVRRAGASFDFLHKRDGLDFRMVVRLASLVRRRGIDLIQAHNVGAGLYAGLAGIITRRPVVNIRHGLAYGVESPGCAGPPGGYAPARCAWARRSWNPPAKTISCPQPSYR